jgi:hypothetical protein
MGHTRSTKTLPDTPRLRRTPRDAGRRRDTHQRPHTTAPRSIAFALTGGPVPAAQAAQLWQMTTSQRVDAMYVGRLSLAQLTAWSARRPDEVPLIGGEFAYIAMRDPEWCEPSRPAGRPT